MFKLRLLQFQIKNRLLKLLLIIIIIPSITLNIKSVKKRIIRIAESYFITFNISRDYTPFILVTQIR